MKKLPYISTAATVLLLTAASPASLANDEEEIPFSVANVFFELNNTDGDLGIHALIDGEPWKKLKIEDTRERKMLNIRLTGRLKKQGLTELFFESAEPTFDELAPEEFFKRFPEGEYEVEGVTLEGIEMESTSVVTHLMPAPPNISVSGMPVPDDCDEDPGPAVTEPYTVSWDPVSTSHPDLGRRDEPIDVVKYELVVEREEPDPLKFSIDLPPSVTSLQLPTGLAGPGEEFKVEVLVREASGNQTATESCFRIAE
jgi:hypothetical protein